jgi:uncharacterized membrane protein HdeD (DUF308 family)
MRAFWSYDEWRSFWLGPALLGVVLIALGVVLYLHPLLLAYFVAGMFILGGCALVGVAWRIRWRVSYRRLDRQWRVGGDETPDA